MYIYQNEKNGGGNELPSHKKTGRTPTRVFGSDKSQSEKVTSCMIPSVEPSGKGKTMEPAKRAVASWGRKDELAEPGGLAGQ